MTMMLNQMQARTYHNLKVSNRKEPNQQAALVKMIRKKFRE